MSVSSNSCQCSQTNQLLCLLWSCCILRSCCIFVSYDRVVSLSLTIVLYLCLLWSCCIWYCKLSIYTRYQVKGTLNSITPATWSNRVLSTSYIGFSPAKSIFTNQLVSNQSGYYYFKTFWLFMLFYGFIEQYLVVLLSCIFIDW